MDHYAVLGFPVGHSLSPYIHQSFAEQTQQELDYEAIEVKPEFFKKVLTDFFSSGGQGVNCTVPLKEMAFEQADVLSDRARLSGAVNTLKLTHNGELYGDNTDGEGLLTDLVKNLKIDLVGKRILILGAGGAARGILAPLLSAAPLALWIANRTYSKGRTLADDFSALGKVNAVDYSELKGEQFDIVINATSASLTGKLPPLPELLLAKQAVCYDLAYSKEPTAFIRWGRQQGARLSVDGLGMLVEQAALAFNIWRDVMPETKSILAELRCSE